MSKAHIQVRCGDGYSLETIGELLKLLTTQAMESDDIKSEHLLVVCDALMHKWREALGAQGTVEYNVQNPQFILGTMVSLRTAMTSLHIAPAHSDAEVLVGMLNSAFEQLKSTDGKPITNAAPSAALH